MNLEAILATLTAGDVLYVQDEHGPLVSVRGEWEKATAMSRVGMVQGWDPVGEIDATVVVDTSGTIIKRRVPVDCRG